MPMTNRAAICGDTCKQLPEPADVLGDHPDQPHARLRREGGSGPLRGDGGTDRKSGKKKYSCHSTAMDQKAPFGAFPPMRSCTRKKCVAMPRRSTSPGPGPVEHAAGDQHGERERDPVGREDALRPPEHEPASSPRSSRNPDEPAPRVSENPDTTMKTVTPKRPNESDVAHIGARVSGNPG